jgi:hypothetical protein
MVIRPMCGALTSLNALSTRCKISGEMVAVIVFEF